MIVRQVTFKNRELATFNTDQVFENKPDVAFLFSSVSTFEDPKFMGGLIEKNRSTQWVGCSTAGEVSQKGVTDETTVITTLKFEKPTSKVKTAVCQIKNAAESFQSGKTIGEKLMAPDLTAIVLIGPGVNVNGSQIVAGINTVVPSKVIVTGGLAGDGGKFAKTYTLSQSGVGDQQLVGLGFYGPSLELKHGCMGGWDAFGKVRKVTKSKDNVVFELDGKPALSIYKEYLGDHAKDLPSSGLMFPFSLIDNETSETGLIRTILAIDEAAGSLTFAGDVPQGGTIRLMQANNKGLVSGARLAAEKANAKKATNGDTFGLVVSCVGRKLVMGANVDDEIEAVGEIFGKQCKLSGFYSYGEISPYLAGVGCQLHNQTMTLSLIGEK